MKAKLYIFGEKMEVKLSDDKNTSFTPETYESKEDFVARVRDVVENDFLEDFTLVQITEADVASNDDDTLKEAFETAEGLQKKLIESVLQERGLLGKKKEPREKIEKRSKEDMMASPEYKEAASHIGKVCTFSPFKSEEVHTGKIAGVALNKTNTIIYYTVVLESGVRKCCGVLNETVVLSDATKEAAKATDKKEEKTTAKATDKKEEKTTAKAKKADKKATTGDDLV